MANISIDYSDLVDEAMQTIVYRVLQMISQNGLMGDHHFYISFLTEIKGARISRYLKKKYPHEMTIVLQHQFEDLSIHNDRLEVTLSFRGIPEKLVIPFVAITAFLDPSVQFGLKFKKPYDMLVLDKQTAEQENEVAEDDKVINISNFLNKRSQ